MSKNHCLNWWKYSKAAAANTDAALIVYNNTITKTLIVIHVYSFSETITPPYLPGSVQSINGQMALEHKWSKVFGLNLNFTSPLHSYLAGQFCQKQIAET